MWTINGKSSDSIKPSSLPIGIPHLFEYVVKEQDAENYIISFDYSEGHSEKLIVDYDNSVKRIFIIEDGNPEIIKSSTIDEGTTIAIEPSLPAGTVIDKCLVNGKPVSGEIMEGCFIYRVSRADVDANQKLSFSCTEKTPATGKVEWTSPMTCWKKNQYGPETEITTGGDVQEGDRLSFTANPPQGQVVDKWTVNGIEIENHSGGNDPNRFWLGVKPEHFVDGKITIGYTKKGAVTGTIEWNETENPMTCWKQNQYGPETEITTGGDVQEGDRLSFTANPPQGQVVDKWTVNGIEIENHSGGNDPNRFWLRVKPEHFVDGKITIGYTKIEAASTKVSFDSNIRCSVNRNGTNTDIESGTTIVYEGERLCFEAMGMPDSAVKGWKINNKKPQGWNGHENTRFEFNLEKKHISQASGGAVAVSCELKEGLNSAALDFDSAKIKCRQNGDELNSGLRVYAGVDIYFNAILSGSEEVKCWKINGVEQTGSETGWFYYTVKDEDLKGNKFTVEIVLK